MMGSEKAAKVFIVLLILAFVFVAKSRAKSDSNTIGTAQLHSMIVDNAHELEAGQRAIDFSKSFSGRLIALTMRATSTVQSIFSARS
jgi:predicted outer membrane protein